MPLAHPLRLRAAVLLLAALVAPAARAGAQHASHAGHGARHGAPAADAVAESPAVVAERDRQLAALRAAVARYADIEVAKAEGFRMFGRRGAPLMGEHWYREELVGAPVDLARPSTLQYALIDGKRVLVGVAFSTIQSRGAALPEGFAGSADQWHVHDRAAIREAVTAGRPVLRAIAERRARRDARRGRPTGDLVMLHVWTGLENPEGIFALHHRALPYATLGLPTAWASLPGASMEAARGLALSHDDACDDELRVKRWLAGLSREQRGTLGAQCERSAAAVRSALERQVAGDPLNAVAAAAWRDYADVVRRTLTAEQRRRAASLTEHPGATGVGGGHEH